MFVNELMWLADDDRGSYWLLWLPCQGSHKQYLSTAQVLLLYFNYIVLQEHFNVVTYYFLCVISEIESDKLYYFYFIYFCIILFMGSSPLREEQISEWIFSIHVVVIVWK